MQLWDAYRGIRSDYAVRYVRQWKPRCSRVGIPLALGSLLAPIVVPLVFGTQWQQTSTLIALLGPGVLAGAMFSVHLAVLVGRRRPWEVLIVNAINASVFWLAAVVLVPNLGITGYGWADVSTLPCWAVDVALYARRHPAPAYGFTLMWGAGLALAMVAPVTSPWLVLPAAILILNPLSVRHALDASRRFSRERSPV